MNNNFVIFIITVWILLAIVGGIGEGAYLGNTDTGTIYNVTHFSAKTLPALFNMFTFHFSMFQGAWVIFQWIFFLPLSVALVLVMLSAGGWIGAFTAGVLAISGLVSFLSQIL